MQTLLKLFFNNSIREMNQTYTIPKETVIEKLQIPALASLNRKNDFARRLARRNDNFRTCRFCNGLLLLLSFLISLTSANAQNVLSVDDAISIALKNNYDIRMARSNADISIANNTSGNAGMLPTAQVTASSAYTYYTNQNQSQSGGAVNLGAELNWNLYDGGKMYVTKEKLNAIQALGEIQYKMMVQQTIFNVISAYYDIIRQKQQLTAIEEVINFNNQLVALSEAGFNAGTLAKTDLLLAKIDLNVAKENAINQKYSITTSKEYLNIILVQTSGNDFEVTDSIPIGIMPNQEELVQKVNTSNINLLNFKKQIDIAKLELKETDALSMPKVGLRWAYNLTQNFNDRTSFENRTYGPQVLATLQVPLYTGGETDRKIAIAQLALQTNEFELQQAKQEVNIELKNTIRLFANQESLLAIETENNDLAKENFKISIERLKYGQTTALEVHQAQEEFVQSNTRLVNFRYNLIIAETKLKQLIAEL